VRAALAGPLPQDRLEVSYVGRYQDTAFGCGKLEDLRVGEPFELRLGVQGMHVVAVFDERLAHRPTGDVGVE
jgi:hypothetical protein